MGKFFKTAKKEESYPKEIKGTPSPHMFWKPLMRNVFPNWGDDAVKTKGAGAAMERVIPFGNSGRHWPLKKNEELKKAPGAKGWLQRALPGGKSGFEVHDKTASLGKAKYRSRTKPVKSPKAPRYLKLKQVLKLHLHLISL